MFGSVHTHVAIRPKLDSIGLLILTFLRNKRGWIVVAATTQWRCRLSFCVSAHSGHFEHIL